MKYNFEAKPSDMKLGDVVKCFDGPFGTGIVRRIATDAVYIFRPYGQSSIVESGNSVICYTGIEEYSFWITSEVKYWVYSRNEDLE